MRKVILALVCLLLATPAMADFKTEKVAPGVGPSGEPLPNQCKYIWYSNVKLRDGSTAEAEGQIQTVRKVDIIMARDREVAKKKVAEDKIAELDAMLVEFDKLWPSE